MTPDSAIAVRNPADLVDATPYVIGFHPTDSLVVLGLSGNRVFFGARYDLPPPDGDDIVQMGAVIAGQRPRCVALLAYGPPAAADPVIGRALAVFDAFGVRVLEALRVHDGRWWSYFCSEAGCCPAQGTPFDTATSVIAAEAIYRGQVALPSRQALVARVAPVDGEARVAMVAATSRARSAHHALLTADERGSRAVRRAGRLAVREAEKRYRSGRTLTDDEVAWLGVLLPDPDVQEYTLDRVGDEEWRLALWTDVLRRVEPAYVPAAGCVLSYLAWRAGQGALARVAVDRALQADPRYPMAGLLDEVLGLGIGPHAMTALESRRGGSRHRSQPASGGPAAAPRFRRERSGSEAPPAERQASERAGGEPSASESTAGESTAGESTAGESTAGESTAREPASRQPTAGKPFMSEQSVGEPSATQPCPDESARVSPLSEHTAPSRRRRRLRRVLRRRSR